MKKILIGSDKSGFMLKEAIKAHLVEKGYKVHDCGTTDFEKPLAFFEVAPVAAKKIQDKEYKNAILICGTGMGMAMVANKFKGVRAAVVESTYTAEKSRAINDSNVLTMGGWIIGEMLGIEIAEKFLNTEFTEGLEEWRKDFLKNARIQFDAIEEKIYS